MRVAVSIAEALLALGRGDEARAWIERAATMARSTGSAKYLGKCHALRGELAIADRRWDTALSELGEAVAIGRRIEYPTLAWQAGHLLAQAQMEARRHDEAVVTARQALDTIDAAAANAPDSGLRKTFLESPRVVTAREDLDRLIRV
jgi:tetratricopeptide (TPR) repeat protein